MKTYTNDEFKELIGSLQYKKIIVDFVESMQDEIEELKTDFYYYDFSAFKARFDGVETNITIEFVYEKSEENHLRIAINNVFVPEDSSDANELLDRINELDKLKELEDGEN